MGSNSRRNRAKRREEERDTIDRSYTVQVTKLFPKTKNQERLIRSISQNHITIASGLAGCGKTLLALHEAVWLLEKGKIDQILYTKPTVNFHEQKGLGFLPGSVDEKVLPLLFPVLDNLDVFVQPGKVKYLLDKKQIQFQLLEYVRGRSLRNCFVICDEFQNVSKAGAITMISRIEESSKLVMVGDPMQSDIKLRDNALSDAIFRLRGADSVGIVEFQRSDIVRSAFLADVIARYDT
jgi:phosphate starvation-inducible PhoH-like protein